MNATTQLMKERLPKKDLLCPGEIAGAVGLASTHPILQAIKDGRLAAAKSTATGRFVVARAEAERFERQAKADAELYESQKAADSADNLRGQIQGYLEDNGNVRQELDAAKRELDRLRRENDFLRAKCGMNNGSHEG